MIRQPDPPNNGYINHNWSDNPPNHGYINHKFESNIRLPFPKMNESFCTYIYIYLYMCKVLISLCMSDHNLVTPWPICLKFWLWKSEEPLSLDWDSKLSGSTFVDKIYFPGKNRPSAGERREELWIPWSTLGSQASMYVR